MATYAERIRSSPEAWEAYKKTISGNYDPGPYPGPKTSTPTPAPTPAPAPAPALPSDPEQVRWPGTSDDLRAALPSTGLDAIGSLATTGDAKDTVSAKVIPGQEPLTPTTAADQIRDTLVGVPVPISQPRTDPSTGRDIGKGVATSGKTTTAPGGEPLSREDRFDPETGLPLPIDFSTSPTGIAVRGTQATITGAGQGVITQETRRTEAELAAQREDQARAGVLAEDVRGDIRETTAGIDTAIEDVQADRERLQAGLEATQERIEGIPEEVTREFDRLQEQFGRAADTSFDRIDAQRGEALGKADEGRSAAMQAAVQGIQGNVNTQVAQIMSNPNLTQSQKQSMVSQVKLSGASSMAPAIGKTVLAFNQLSADIATKFGSISGQIESTVLGAKAQLTGLQGQAFSQAQVAVGQISSQLLEIDASAAASFANSQSQLLATRSHATMTGNETLLRILPEQSTPYLDLTGAAVAAYTIGSDVLKSQFAMDLQTAGMAITQELVESMKGTQLDRIIAVGSALIGAVR